MLSTELSDGTIVRSLPGGSHDSNGRLGTLVFEPDQGLTQSAVLCPEGIPGAPIFSCHHRRTRLCLEQSRLVRASAKLLKTRRQGVLDLHDRALIAGTGLLLVVEFDRGAV